jgi:hypothetical protein
MDVTFIQWLIGQSGIGAVAGLAIYMLSKTYADALRREREYAEANREDKKAMMTLFAENARVLSALQNAIEGLRNVTH